MPAPRPANVTPARPPPPQPSAAGAGRGGGDRRSPDARGRTLVPRAAASVLEEGLAQALAGCPEGGAALLLLRIEESGPADPAGPSEPLVALVAERLAAGGAWDVRLACRQGEESLAVLLAGPDAAGRAVDLAGAVGDGRFGPACLERLGTLAAGVALHPEHGLDAAELRRAAGVALAAARRDGGASAVVVFDRALDASIAERRALEAALRGAVARGEFGVAYQPIVDLRTRRLHGVEALLRWEHPRLGRVPPDRFVPVLEELRLIRPVTEWLAGRCAEDLAPVLAACPDLRVSVNLAACQVEPRQMAALLAALERLGLHRVTLEITERALLDASPAPAAALAAARAAGVTLALDDFGTGYSSLAYLERFPIDAVKIDKRFVAKLPADGRLADAILGIAAALGPTPVAEGVEDGDQLAWLVSRGCRLAQGHLFAPALDPGALFAYAASFRFPAERLDAALWPPVRALPPLLSENQEQALRQFVRHVPVALAMFDTGMRYLVASDRWLEDYGVEEREIIGRCHYEVLPGTPERWRRVHERCLREGTVERCDEDVFVRADGRGEWLRWEVHPFRNRLGHVAGIIIFTEFVTARKEAERRLAESEARLRELVRNSSDWLWETDREHRFVFDSDDMRKGGVRPSRLLGRTRWELAGVADPHSSPLWRAHLADLAARRPFQRFEYAATDEAGRPAHFEVSGAPVFDERDEFRGYRGTTCNVTARKEAERRLAESEARLRDYLATASDWAWEMDAGLRFTAFSGNLDIADVAAGPMLGVTRWEMGGVTDPDADPVWREHKADLEARRPFRDFLFARTTRAGGTRWFSASGIPVFDPDGTFRGYRGTARDVTAAKAAETTRERQTQQLELASELAELGYWEVDHGRRTTTWSAGVLAITGHDPASAPGFADRLAIVHPDDRGRVGAEIADALAQGRDFEYRARVLRPDGTVRHVVSRGRPRLAADGRAVASFGILLDVTRQVEAQEALEARGRENELYRAMIDALPDFIFAKDGQNRFLAANAATAALMRADSPRALVGRTDADFYPPDLAAGFRADEEAFFADGGRTVIVEQPARRLDGSPGWLCSLKTALRDAEGRVVGYVGHGRDVTEARAAREEVERLRGEAERARAMLAGAAEVLADGFALFDPDGGLALCNAAFAEPHGTEPGRLLGRSFAELTASPAFRAALGMDDGAFAAWFAWRLAKHRAADGVPFELRVGTGWYLVREQRTPDGSILFTRTDVTQLKRVEEELRRLATVDALTGAFNRRYFIEHGERLLRRCRADGAPAAMALLDIDRFKEVNDGRGHAAGDEALRRVCEACLERLRPGDLFARWGGEEFVLLLPGTGRSEALAAAERLRRAVGGLVLRPPGGGDEFRVTLSVGVALDDGGGTLDDLARRADRCLYAAKAGGRNRTTLQPAAVARPA